MIKSKLNIKSAGSGIFYRSLADSLSITFFPPLVIIFALFFGSFKTNITNPGPFIFLCAVNCSILMLYLLRILIRKKIKLSEFKNVLNAGQGEIYLLLTYSLTVCTIFFIIFKENYWYLIGMLLVTFFGGMYLLQRFILAPSLYLATFCFVVMFLTGRLEPIIAVLFSLTPLLFWSRMFLKMESWNELFLGAVIGMAIGLLSWTI